MSRRLALAVALIWSGVTIVAAAPRPQIPASELPGRERERFIDPYPQQRNDPGLMLPGETRPIVKRKCKIKRGTKARRGC